MGRRFVGRAAGFQLRCFGAAKERATFASGARYGEGRMTTLSAKNQEQQMIQRLLQVPLFNRMSGRHIQLLVKVAQSVKVNAGDLLWLDGDDPESLFVLLSGEVEIFAAGEKVDHIKPVQTLGEVPLLSGERHDDEAVCATPCVLLDLSAQVIAQVLQRNSEICQRICRNAVGMLALKLQQSNDAVGALGEECRALEEKIEQIEHQANDLNMIRSLRGG